MTSGKSPNEPYLSVTGPGGPIDDSYPTWPPPELDPGDEGSLLALYGALLDRLEVQGQLGRGGGGEVLRVWDPVLRRGLALKVLAGEEGRRRFLEEARVTARLQHPGVVPVFALGALPRGAMAYAMAEVRGRTLDATIAEVHSASSAGEWRPAPSGWTFRRLVAALQRICETVAYAHSQGVVHRDLKPQNVMLGDFGEVQVLDWGLARHSGPEPDTWPPSGEETVFGQIMGTPAYMAPEQAVGDTHRIGTATDVFALGAMLYQVLTGLAPFAEKTALLSLDAARRGSVPPLVAPGPIPPELESALWRALERRPEDRYPDAGALSEALSAWLEGTLREEQARALVAEADALGPEIAALREAAAEARARAVALLAPVPRHAPASEKAPGWALEDEAARLDQERVRMQALYTQRLHSALQLYPDLLDAHDRLADLYQAEHAEAAARGDMSAAVRAEGLLAAHDRGRHAAWLSGEGRLDLDTTPSGALATLSRFVLEGRRLIPRPVAELGSTPIRDLRLPHGSYKLELFHPECEPVSLLLSIGRGQAWDGCRPGDGSPRPLWLPPRGTLRQDEVYVPEGWFWSGGDARAADPAPRRRHWLDGFAIQRFPVTAGAWLAFLQDLARRDPDAAWQAAPRRPGASPSDPPLYPFGTDGLPRLPEGPLGDPELPAQRLRWEDAVAFAAWRARQDGLPWRLPHELEREKAGRGVDGRAYPWGETFDSSWAAVQTSHAGPPAPVSVHAFPGDESPYGVRGLSGGSCDWCCNAYRRAGWPDGAAVDPRPEAIPPDGFVAVRGGWWGGSERNALQWSRFADRPGIRTTSNGVRLARSLGPQGD